MQVVVNHGTTATSMADWRIMEVGNITTIVGNHQGTFQKMCMSGFPDDVSRGRFIKPILITTFNDNYNVIKLLERDV